MKEEVSELDMNILSIVRSLYSLAEGKFGDINLSSLAATDLFDALWQVASGDAITEEKKEALLMICTAGGMGTILALAVMGLNGNETLKSLEDGNRTMLKNNFQRVVSVRNVMSGVLASGASDEKN